MENKSPPPAGFPPEAMDAVKAIFKDCCDRRGIKWEFAKVDPAVIEEDILPAWAKIVNDAILAQAREPAPPEEWEKLQACEFAKIPNEFDEMKEGFNAAWDVCIERIAEPQADEIAVLERRLSNLQVGSNAHLDLLRGERDALAERVKVLELGIKRIARNVTPDAESATIDALLALLRTEAAHGS